MAGRANRTFKPRQICGSGIALEPVRLCPASTSRPPEEREAAIAAHAARVAAGLAAEGRQTRCFGCGATPHRARGDGDKFAARRSGWEVRYRRQGSSTGAESLCPDCFRKWGWW